ncbi:MAG: CoA transferase subunit A [Promethearchaeota archaeon]
MKILQEGEGKLVGWHDPDEQRAWVQKKTRAMVDKRMSISDAVKKYVTDGDVIAMGGFGHIRVSMAAIYEMIRQKVRNLIMMGKTGVHDIDVMIGGGIISQVEVAYCFGHEMRGLSKCGRNAVEAGKVKVVSEISNAGHQWRFLGGMMGVPFIPTRTMLGSDTLKKSSAKVVEDPWTKKPICLLPSANPDIAFIHVPRCDIYGNCQYDGYIVEDFEIARAARKLVITTEEIIDNEVIRETPWRTVIPGFFVDAVVEVKYGSHPCNMPGQYYFDEEVISEWLDMSKTDEGLKQWLDKYVYNVKDFTEYLEICGGEEKMEYLYKLEHYQAPLKAPWLDRKLNAGGKK